MGKDDIPAVDETPAPDAAVAVSVPDLKRLLAAAGKHAGKDADLAVALAPFAEI